MPQPHQKRRPQNQRPPRQNKAKQREAQVRAEQMAAEPSADLLGSAEGDLIDESILEEVAPVVPAPAATIAPRVQSPRKDTRGQVPSRRAVVAPAGPVISRAEEYEFVRADLRRLLITAGAVLVLMLALLFVIEG